MSIGERFAYGQKTYEMRRVERYGDNLPHLKRALESGGKIPATFYASLVLKSGAVSQKQGAAFYKFKESGNFIKVQ